MGSGVTEGVEEGMKYVAVTVNVGVAVGVWVIVGVKSVGVAVCSVGVILGWMTSSRVAVGVSVVRAVIAVLPIQRTTNPRR